MRFGYTGDMPESNENQLAIGELLNKRIVLFSLCGIAWVLSFAVVALAVRQLPIPDSLDRLVTFILGNLSGVLTMTGLNRAIHGRGTPEEPVEVKASEPLPVVTRDEEESGDGDEAPGLPPNNPSEFTKAVRTN